MSQLLIDMHCGVVIHEDTTKHLCASDMSMNVSNVGRTRLAFVCCKIELRQI